VSPFSSSADSPNTIYPPTPTAWILAVGVGFLTFLTYAATLAPTVVGGDSGELITAAVTLGVPHPSGYPLYCLLGRLFAWLVPFGSPAFRINLFSGITGAVAVGLLTYLVVTAGARLAGSRKPLFLAAAGASTGLLWAWSKNFWSQAVIAEVYTLHVCFVMGYLICLFNWSEQREEKWLYRSALLLGFSMTNHQLTFLMLPPLAFQGIVTVWGKPAGKWLSAGLKTLALFAAPLVIYLYLPIRAFMDAPYDWAKATNLQAFIEHVTRKQYQGLGLKENLSGLVNAKRFLNPALLLSYTEHLRLEYSWLWLASVAGLIPLLRRPRLALPLIFIWVMGSFFIWSNIRVSEHSHYLFDVFLLAGEPALLALVGVGLLWVLERIGRTRRGMIAMAAILSLIPIGTASAHLHKVDRRGDYIVYDIYRHMLDSLPKNAVYFAFGDTNTSALLYLKLVEKKRPDVTVVDYNGGQVFKETPPNWHPSTKDPEKHRASLKSMADFVEKATAKGYPIYIAYGHPLINEMASGIVPYGPMAHWNPAKASQRSFHSDFPWGRLKIRGLETGALFADNWNWIAVGDSLLGRVFEQYGMEGIPMIDNFAKILLLAPETWLNDGGLSLLYISQGRLEEALQTQYRAAQRNPKNPMVFYNLGLLYAAAGSEENTVILWEHAQHLYPGWVKGLEGVEEMKALQRP
jgi:tetratricopeptide (TPR) repeat protein